MHCVVLCMCVCVYFPIYCQVKQLIKYQRAGQPSPPLPAAVIRTAAAGCAAFALNWETCECQLDRGMKMKAGFHQDSKSSSTIEILVAPPPMPDHPAEVPVWKSCDCALAATCCVTDSTDAQSYCGKSPEPFQYSPLLIDNWAAVTANRWLVNSHSNYAPTHPPGWSIFLAIRIPYLHGCRDPRVARQPTNTQFSPQPIT